MSQDSFWCIKLSPGTVYKINIPESTELKLTNACIVPQTPPLPSRGVSFMTNPPPQTPLQLTRLYFHPDSSDGTNNQVLLGTFIPNKIEHQIIQYTIQSDRCRTSTLQNVSTGGPGEILHICGTISTIDQKMSYEEDEKSNHDKNDDENSNDFQYGANDDDDGSFNLGGQNFFGAFGL